MIVGRAAGWAARISGAAVMLALAAALPAQTAPDPGQTVPDNQVADATGLNIPANLQIFGHFDPNVRKPTAIVNDFVITGTDVDQRVALIIAANNLELSAQDKDKLKLQVLRQLIDETLKIQEAKAHEVEVTADEIGQGYARVASNFNSTPVAFAKFLHDKGSSERSLRRQIQGELAWSRYLRRRVEPQVNVSTEEIEIILKQLERDKGTEEFHLAEIYLDGPNAMTSASQLLDQIKGGRAPFGYYARNFSASSSKGVEGDLGWLRAATLPDPLAQAVKQMQIGQVAGPIEVPGGASILYLVDKRQVLTADPRDAKLNLKQLTLHFPPGTTQADATARAATFAKTVQAIRGCGTVERTAAGIGAEVVTNDAVQVRALPPQLQSILLALQVGQATPPFGSPQEGVRALVLCGRDDPVSGTLPDAEQLRSQREQTRVNLRADQMLRDLRRDAIIEYR